MCQQWWRDRCLVVWAFRSLLFLDKRRACTLAHDHDCEQCKADDPEAPFAWDCVCDYPMRATEASYWNPQYQTLSRVANTESIPVPGTPSVLMSALRSISLSQGPMTCTRA